MLDDFKKKNRHHIEHNKRISPDYKVPKKDHTLYSEDFEILCYISYTLMFAGQVDGDYKKKQTKIYEQINMFKKNQKTITELRDTRNEVIVALIMKYFSQNDRVAEKHQVWD